MDGAHLKGEFKGSILHAVYMDGEDHIVPIGYGICKSESIDSWTWFLEKLHECIGEMENLSFITDRAASIAVGIQNVFPIAVHGICAFHLLQNVRAKFGKNDKTKTMFWDILQAYKTSDLMKVSTGFVDVDLEKESSLAVSPSKNGLQHIFRV